MFVELLHDRGRQFLGLVAVAHFTEYGLQQSIVYGVLAILTVRHAPILLRERMLVV